MVTRLCQQQQRQQQLMLMAMLVTMPQRHTSSRQLQLLHNCRAAQQRSSSTASLQQQARLLQQQRQQQNLLKRGNMPALLRRTVMVPCRKGTAVLQVRLGLTAAGPRVLTAGLSSLLLLLLLVVVRMVLSCRESQVFHSGGAAAGLIGTDSVAVADLAPSLAAGIQSAAGTIAAAEASAGAAAEAGVEAAAGVVAGRSISGASIGRLRIRKRSGTAAASISASRAVASTVRRASIAARSIRSTGSAAEAKAEALACCVVVGTV
jgi:hypothetical protein